MDSHSMLTDNLDKLHTTELGTARIKKNLSLLDVDDVVEWCRQQITDCDSIKRQEKNWYVSTENGCIITVNANSYTIITAHRSGR